jgi:hypothetical protein
MTLKKTPLQKGNKPLQRRVKDHPLPPKFCTKEEIDKAVKKAIKRKPLTRKKKSEEQIAQELYEREKMTAFFMDCVKVLGRVSDVSGREIREPGRINYHHIFPKADSAYPMLKYSFNNILICTAQEHDEIHNDIDRYPIVRQKLNFIRDNMEYCQQQGESWSEEYDRRKQSEL